MWSGGVQRADEFVTAGAQPRRIGYLLYLPPSYGQDEQQRWPLLLFLHGAGERGHDLQAVRQHGIPKVLDQGKELPCLAISPQCPPGERWSTIALSELLDDVQQRYDSDPERIYVTGLSMGGSAAWDLAIRRPNQFAAIVPVCGRGDPAQARAIAHLPIWAFHGANDEAVPVETTIDMVAAIRRCGGAPRLTIYPEAGHDSWTKTFANPELYSWLFVQARQ